jgi:colanic acid/amylovoran biosynthesis glycosyltransferase
MAASPRYITVVALCAVERTAGGVRINRKFHTGMLEYVRRLPLPLACVLPETRSGQDGGEIDVIEVPSHQLPYVVHAVSGTEPSAADLRVLADIVDGSALVYCGTGAGLNLQTARLCRERGVTYAATTEYPRRTELDIMRAETASPLRRLVRSARIRWNYRRKRELIVQAAEVHANGYPSFREAENFGVRQILFFDSRMTAAEIIEPQALESRLESLRSGQRGPRLFYSGRYHPMKGTLDVVYAGIALRGHRQDFRLDLFGDGPLKAEMQRVVQQHDAGDYIAIHEPVPFSPDLIEIARRSDVFLCPHRQGDPSCTYVETFGSGVPIVGYANSMWTPLSAASGAGVVVGRSPRAMADAVANLLADHERLAEYSRKAREFAAGHVMEKMWDLRCTRLKALLGKDSAVQHQESVPQSTQRAQR